MFFAADSSRYKPDIRCGDIHLCIFASLTKELVVHQDWHVHDFYLFEYVDERFTDIEDGYFTTSAYGKPFFGKSSCHVEPPTGLELVVRRSHPHNLLLLRLIRAWTGLPCLLHTCSPIQDRVSKCINTYRLTSDAASVTQITYQCDWNATRRWKPRPGTSLGTD